MDKKKSITKEDSLIQDDAASLAMETPTELQHEGRPSRRNAVRNDSRTSKVKDAADTSHDGKNNDNNNDIVVEVRKVRKSRTRKAHQQEPEETLESLRSGREYFRGLYEQERAKTRELKTKKAAINKENLSRRKNQTTLKQEIKFWQAETQNKQRSVAELEKEVAGKNQIIVRSSEAHFRHIGKGASNGLDDNYVRNRLEEIRMLRQNWVLEHAVSSLDSVPEQFINRLLDYGKPKAVSRQEDQSTYQLFVKEKGAPRMLLGDLVLYSCRQLLEDPFAFLERPSYREDMGLQRVLDHGMPSKSECMELVISKELTFSTRERTDDSYVASANGQGLESWR